MFKLKEKYLLQKLFFKATPISMVNQYLVQQQIQLEAARRDAGKERKEKVYKERGKWRHYCF